MARQDALNAPRHPAIPDLERLFFRLRKSDQIPLDIDREVRCRLLLEQLTALGVSLDDPESACLWLVPLLAMDEHAQEIVRARIYGEASGAKRPAESMSERAVDDTASAQSGGRARRTRGYLFLAAALAGLVVAALAAWALFPPAPLNPIGDKTMLAYAQQSSMRNYYKFVLAALFTSAVMLVLDWRRRRSSAGVVLSAGEEVLRRRSIDPTEMRFFDDARTQAALRGLSKLPPAASGRHVNVDATIRASAKAGGIPQLVLVDPPRVPRYLVLVDQHSKEEQVALLYAALLDRLRMAGVSHHALVFSNDPQWLSPFGETGQALEPLWLVVKRCAGYRLLLLSDGARFYDPVADALRPGVAKLLDFSPRILLTPADAREGTGQNDAFAERGFIVASLTSAGVKQIADWLGESSFHPARQEGRARADYDLAARLDRQTDRWMRASPPDPQAAVQLVGELKRYLGAAAFRLFAAIAAHRDPAASMTVHISAQFRQLGDVVDEAGMGRLARLPWMRQGDVPDWLRRMLLAELPMPFREAAQGAYIGFLTGMKPGHARLSGSDRARLGRLVGSRARLEGLPADAIFEGLVDPYPAPRRRWADFMHSLVAVGIGVLVYWYGTDILVFAANTVADLVAAWGVGVDVAQLFAMGLSIAGPVTVVWRARRRRAVSMAELDLSDESAVKLAIALSFCAVLLAIGCVESGDARLGAIAMLVTIACFFSAVLSVHYGPVRLFLSRWRRSRWTSCGWLFATLFMMGGLPGLVMPLLDSFSQQRKVTPAGTPPDLSDADKAAEDAASAAAAATADSVPAATAVSDAHSAAAAASNTNQGERTATPGAAVASSNGDASPTPPSGTARIQRRKRPTTPPRQAATPPSSNPSGTETLGPQDNAGPHATTNPTQLRAPLLLDDQANKGTRQTAPTIAPQKNAAPRSKTNPAQQRAPSLLDNQTNQETSKEQTSPEIVPQSDVAPRGETNPKQQRAPYLLDDQTNKGLSTEQLAPRGGKESSPEVQTTPSRVQPDFGSGGSVIPNSNLGAPAPQNAPATQERPSSERTQQPPNARDPSGEEVRQMLERELQQERQRRLVPASGTEAAPPAQN